MWETHPAITVLDGEYAEFSLRGTTVGVVGAKGYGGGFAPYRLVARGEQSTKAFLQEEDREVRKLKAALEKMREACPTFQIVLTHWAAFQETVKGEPKELYIALGSSRLGDAIESINPDLVLSGHAHHGPSTIQKARGKISTCNIAYKVHKGKMPLFDFFSQGKIALRYSESH